MLSRLIISRMRALVQSPQRNTLRQAFSKFGLNVGFKPVWLILLYIATKGSAHLQARLSSESSAAAARLKGMEGTLAHALREARRPPHTLRLDVFDTVFRALVRETPICSWRAGPKIPNTS